MKVGLESASEPGARDGLGWSNRGREWDTKAGEGGKLGVREEVEDVSA